MNLKSFIDKAIHSTVKVKPKDEDILEIELRVAIRKFRLADEHYRAILQATADNERIELAYHQWAHANRELDFMIRKYKESKGISTHDHDKDDVLTA